MSNNIPLKQQQSQKHETPTSSSGGGGGRKTSTLRPPDQTLKCPRCDSTNTKFCYYNNYNLTQPRHFCKTCRRYWTKGGALRNIPIGGGCRKNKKTTKSCNSKFIIGDSTSDHNIGGLKLLDSNLSSPVMDFQLYPSRINQFSSFYTPSNLPFMNLDPLGLINYPKGDINHNQIGFTYTNLHQGSSTLTSTIESLSSLNQDLHWKLQQQRLAMMFGGGGDGGGDGGGGGEDHQQNEIGLQPILFQNLEIPRKDGGSGSGSGNGGVGGLATECLFHNSYAPVNVNNIPASSSGSINNNWYGVEGWNHMNQFNAIP